VTTTFAASMAPQRIFLTADAQALDRRHRLRKDEGRAGCRRRTYLGFNAEYPLQRRIGDGFVRWAVVADTFKASLTVRYSVKGG
jgi:hypothetical protein